MADDLKREFREALPFASVVALTRTAVIARDKVRERKRGIFDRPTPYDLNATRAVPATKQTMASAVIERNTAGGTRAENYEGPEIEGGARRVKRFEMALRAKGVLPPDMYVVPGKAARLDRFGNISATDIVKVLQGLQAFSGYQSRDSGAAHARRSRLGMRSKRGIYYVAKSKLTGRPLGIWQVVAKGKVAPVMVFTRRPEYRERFDFYGLVRGYAEEAFPPQLDAALGKFAGK